MTWCSIFASLSSAANCPSLKNVHTFTTYARAKISACLQALRTLSKKSPEETPKRKANYITVEAGDLTLIPRLWGNKWHNMTICGHRPKSSLGDKILAIRKGDYKNFFREGEGKHFLGYGKDTGRKFPFSRFFHKSNKDIQFFSSQKSLNCLMFLLHHGGSAYGNPPPVPPPLAHLWTWLKGSKALAGLFCAGVPHCLRLMALSKMDDQSLPSPAKRTIEQIRHMPSLACKIFALWTMNSHKATNLVSQQGNFSAFREGGVHKNDLREGDIVSTKGTHGPGGIGGMPPCMWSSICSNIKNELSHRPLGLKNSRPLVT